MSPNVQKCVSERRLQVLPNTNHVGSGERSIPTITSHNKIASTHSTWLANLQAFFFARDPAQVATAAPWCAHIASSRANTPRHVAPRTTCAASVRLAGWAHWQSNTQTWREPAIERLLWLGLSEYIWSEGGQDDPADPKQPTKSDFQRAPGKRLLTDQKYKIPRFNEKEKTSNSVA